MRLFLFLAFTVGSFFLGSFLTWLYLNTPDRSIVVKQNDFMELLQNARAEIPTAAFNCEIKGRTVADVMAARGFVALNSNRVGKTTFDCDDKSCSMNVSNCRPWQSSECGGTILRYEIDSQRKIIPSSFSCLDIP